MRSLTRDEASQRAALLSVDSYDLDLDLTLGADTFGSSSRIRFRGAAPGASTFADVAPRELRSATLNGARLGLDAAFDSAAGRLRLDNLEPTNELVVEARMSYSHDGEGLHRHVDPADGQSYLYAMSFLAAAPRWFACFDQPDLKAPVRIEVRCPDEWVVMGNGPATRLEAGRWRLAATGPLATYFTTLVAGPYHVMRDVHDGVPLGLLARKSLADHLERQAGALFAHTKHCLDRLHALFDVRYPWGEYNQAFVPEFNAGAMENPGCVTFRDTLLFRSRVTDAELLTRDVTIAHEMAHMWFGDVVTMRWWDDLWLNESFAEYLGCRVTGERSWVDFGIARKAWGYAADRRPSTHPVAGNGAADAASALLEFDGISYAKGASALRQLALQLGDEVFVAGLRDYIRAHADGNAEFADLMAAWTFAGANDVDAWTQAWLRTTGLDALSVDHGAVVRRSTDGAARTHVIAVAGFGADGRELAATRLSIDADRTPVDLAGALLLPDALDETWAKVSLPARSWEQLPRMLPEIAEARTRVAIWNALQLAVADAEVPPALAVDVVAAGLPAETDDAVLGAVGGWATRTLADCYLSDAARPAALTRLSGAMLGLADMAAAGSSRQLAAVRIVAAASYDIGRLQRWLGGADLPEGAVMDAELRWTVVRRLARLGAIDGTFIDAEAARDRSSQGAVHAARCRAALRDTDAKAAAWTAIMTDGQRANYELYALADGFWDPDQRALTDAYVERYFTEIAATAGLRSGFVVQRLALLAYPWPAVASTTLAASERLLADEGLDGAIRRSVIDAGDDLRRALAARNRYG